MEDGSGEGTDGGARAGHVGGEGGERDRQRAVRNGGERRGGCAAQRDAAGRATLASEARDAGTITSRNCSCGGGGGGGCGGVTVEKEEEKVRGVAGGGGERQGGGGNASGRGRRRGCREETRGLEPTAMEAEAAAEDLENGWGARRRGTGLEVALS
ncbi:Protein of unknown function [Gryllus bimaculatus]|nr:Protein of unknown function [Gryllus bimaculatus]